MVNLNSIKAVGVTNITEINYIEAAERLGPINIIVCVTLVIL